MKLSRRQFLHLSADAAALPAFSRTAGAQTYPTRPVWLVVSYPAGNAPDIIARLTGEWLSERSRAVSGRALGQQAGSIL